MTRKELLKAARAATDDFTGHLAECPECREYVLMLRSFNASNRLPLVDAPRSWVERAASLGQSEGVLKRSVRILADIVFDSWTVPHPVGVRGESATDHRRLRFESPELTFDLHAEQHGSEWAFVAQATGSKASLSGIRVGRTAIMPDAGGIYQWSSKRPPKKIALLAEHEIIELPELKWKKQQTK